MRNPKGDFVMWKSIVPSMIVAAGLTVSGTAFAESDYTSSQIVEFFVKSANMGAARGICVGTVDECSRKPAKPLGFDMLVNFEYNSAELTREAQINLDQIADALKDQRLSGAKFTVEGHTDATGSEGYNLGLSEQRAQTVTSFLLERGVTRGKVTALGMGESTPRAEDAFDPVNRRVEIHINLQ